MSVGPCVNSRVQQLKLGVEILLLTEGLALDEDLGDHRVEGDLTGRAEPKAYPRVNTGPDTVQDRNCVGAHAAVRPSLSCFLPLNLAGKGLGDGAPYEINLLPEGEVTGHAHLPICRRR